MAGWPHAAPAPDLTLVAPGGSGDFEARLPGAGIRVATLTRAYRASMTPELTLQRVLAASTLANVLSGLGDLQQALALNQEVIDWDMEHEMWLDLSVTRFLRGQIHPYG